MTEPNEDVRWNMDHTIQKFDRNDICLRCGHHELYHGRLHCNVCDRDAGGWNYELGQPNNPEKWAERCFYSSYKEERKDRAAAAAWNSYLGR